MGRAHAKEPLSLPYTLLRYGDIWKGRVAVSGCNCHSIYSAHYALFSKMQLSSYAAHLECVYITGA